MELELWKEYRRADGKPFSFGHKTGTYIGLTPNGMPRFQLNADRECFMNVEPTTENFIEVTP